MISILLLKFEILKQNQRYKRFQEIKIQLIRYVSQTIAKCLQVEDWINKYEFINQRVDNFKNFRNLKIKIQYNI